MFRTISVAAIAAIWATSVSAAPVHFDSKLGIGNALAAPGIVRGAPAHGLRNKSAFASMQSAAAKKIAGVISSARPKIPPLASGGGNTGGGGAAVAVPTVMPLPGGIVLLAGGLGFLLIGAGLGRRREIA